MPTLTLALALLGGCKLASIDQVPADWWERGEVLELEQDVGPELVLWREGASLHMERRAPRVAVVFVTLLVLAPMIVAPFTFIKADSVAALLSATAGAWLHAFIIGYAMGDTRLTVSPERVVWERDHFMGLTTDREAMPREQIREVVSELECGAIHEQLTCLYQINARSDDSALLLFSMQGLTLYPGQQEQQAAAADNVAVGIAAVLGVPAADSARPPE